MNLSTTQKLETLAGKESGFGFYISEDRCRKAGRYHIDILGRCSPDKKGIELVEKWGGWHKVDLSYPHWHFHRNIPVSMAGWSAEYAEFFKSQIGKGGNA